MLLLAIFDMKLFCTSVVLLLFHMLNGKTYTEREIQSIAPHLIELLSRQFLGNYLKIANRLFFFFDGYFKQTSEISLKPVPEQG